MPFQPPYLPLGAYHAEMDGVWEDSGMDITDESDNPDASVLVRGDFFGAPMVGRFGPADGRFGFSRRAGGAHTQRFDSTLQYVPNAGGDNDYDLYYLSGNYQTYLVEFAFFGEPERMRLEPVAPAGRWVAWTYFPSIGP